MTPNSDTAPPTHAPTLTVVETQTGGLYAVIASFDTDTNPAHSAPPCDGIIHYALTLQSALDEAYNYLYATPPYGTNSPTNPKFIIRMHPSPASARAAYAAHAQVKLRLSNRAYTQLQADTARFKYNGRALHLGMLNYLLALIKANPDPTCWRDTRPDALTQFDKPRLARNRFPYWSQGDYSGDNRRPRSVNPRQLAQLEALLAPIYTHFGITPGRKLQTDPRNRAHATIEAIGLKYLTPLRPPLANPRPPDPTRKPKTKYWELPW